MIINASIFLIIISVEVYLLSEFMPYHALLLSKIWRIAQKSVIL